MKLYILILFNLTYKISQAKFKYTVKFTLLLAYTYTSKLKKKTLEFHLGKKLKNKNFKELKTKQFPNSKYSIYLIIKTFLIKKTSNTKMHYICFAIMNFKKITDAKKKKYKKICGN